MKFKFRTKDKTGATAIEYGLIAALIAVALITALSAISGKQPANELATEPETEQPAAP